MASEKDKGLEKERLIVQSYLPVLRKIAGFTSENLGKKLGITKQSVQALESKRSNLNQIHYLALKMIFLTKADEMKKNGDKNSARVLKMLFSSADFYENNSKKIDDDIKEIISKYDNKFPVILEASAAAARASFEITASKLSKMQEKS